MSRSVIVSAVRTPVRQARRRARRLAGDRARRARDPGCARPRRRRRRRDRVRDHGPGAPGRRRPGACAPGGDRRGPADRAAGRHDQQGLRVEHPRGRDRRPDDPRRATTASIVAGGMESMSNAPYALEEGAVRLQLGDGTLVDLMVHDGLTSTFDGRHMVEQASFVVARARHHARGAGRVGAALAQRAPRARSTRAGSPTRSSRSASVAADEGPRRDTSLEKLAALKPVFDPEGTTTAGNAPGVNDGAGALVVTSEEFATEARPRGAGHDRRPRLRRRRVRLPRADAGAARGTSRSTKAGQDDRRRQARRGERGVLLGRAQLDRAARRRPGDA